MANDKKTPAWVWFGCGCAALALLIVGGCVAAGFFGVHSVKGWMKDLENPETRNARAQEMLGAESLPDGYHAQMFMKVPFVMDMVLLSDGAPMVYQDGQGELESENLGEHAFVYIAMRDMGDQRQQLEDVLAGKKSKLDNVKMDFDFEPEALLGRGELDVGNQHVRYAAHRGRFQNARGKDLDGLFTMMLIDCPRAKDRVRMAYFWQREAEIGEQAEADLGGTVADEAVLAGFLGHFSLCGG